MIIPSWQLATPISAVVFDCDGTLTTIEGIDELAKYNAVTEQVKKMTAIAMGQTGINPELYQARLQLVNPRHEHLLALGKQYFQHQVPEAKDVICLLKNLKKEIYLVSAGLFPAISFFGAQLEIPEQNIFAVNIQFDESGAFIQYETHSPLVRNDGKREIVNQLKAKHQNIIYVGDGLNDLAVYDLVTRFIGYGGAFYRKNIEEKCQYYLRHASLSALLPLILTKSESEILTNTDRLLYQKGLKSFLSSK